jgi:Fe-S-cluster containining protein
MAEIIRHEIEGKSAFTLAAAVREMGAKYGVTRIEVGEGNDRLIVADRNESRGRSCGGCTFCCTAAGINALEKPPMTRCRHLGRGCTIYAQRPQACREFRCAWHLGNWDKRFRPDKVGAYVGFFLTDDHGCYAVVMADSKKLNHRRFRQLLSRLDYLPEIRVIYDDKNGVLLRHDEPPRRFKMLPRPPGDFETGIYQFET